MAAARLKRERRLRSWWRYEAQRFKAALAADTNHSAPRNQKPGRAREDELFFGSVDEDTAGDGRSLWSTMPCRRTGPATQRGADLLGVRLRSTCRCSCPTDAWWDAGPDLAANRGAGPQVRASAHHRYVKDLQPRPSQCGLLYRYLRWPSSWWKSQSRIALSSMRRRWTVNWWTCQRSRHSWRGVLQRADR